MAIAAFSLAAVAIELTVLQVCRVLSLTPIVVVDCVLWQPR